LSVILGALAAADLSLVPKFAAARVWLATNSPERWEEQWAARVRPVLGLQ